MLHFSYCRFTEPALKQCVDPLTFPVNPSAQSNGHLKKQYLLLTMWLLGCKAFNAKNLFREHFVEYVKDQLALYKFYAIVEMAHFQEQVLQLCS